MFWVCAGGGSFALCVSFVCFGFDVILFVIRLGMNFGLLFVLGCVFVCWGMLFCLCLIRCFWVLFWTTKINGDAITRSAQRGLQPRNRQPLQQMRRSD